MTRIRHYLAVFALAWATPPVLAQQAPASVIATVHADRPGPTYDRRIFTQFAEHLGTGIYGGLWVGPDSAIPNTRGFRNDVVAALKAIGVPMVRWPGGCFADEYHWREGIGPRTTRPVKVNTHWGGVTEPNAVGTHEYLDLVGQLGADAYISGNVGNGTPQEMAEWVEYITAPAGSLADLRAKNGRKAPWALPVFGIGNELWGCGGNMRPEYAADVTRRYATFVVAPAGTRIAKVASGANIDDYSWTETMMRVAGRELDGLSLHYYTVPGGWPPRKSATEFDENGWAETLSLANRMDELVTRHSAIMDKYDPAKRVLLAVDEWGTWFRGEAGSNPGFLHQQNTLRDALVAAINLNIFARHADRVKVSAIAQMVNVLQAMILTDGAKMVKTPTYYVFQLYRPFQDATVLPVEIAAPTYRYGPWSMPAVSVSAVRDPRGCGARRARQSRSQSTGDDHGDARRGECDARVRAGADRSDDECAQHLRCTRRGRAGAVRRRERRGWPVVDLAARQIGGHGRTTIATLVGVVAHAGSASANKIPCCGCGHRHLQSPLVGL